jgi:hypothetical protein
MPYVVVFEGVDASGHPGLWETNGTVSGTFELISGVSPSNLTAFNGEVLFEDVNSSALWVTNSTGTFEVQGTAGLTPNGLTVFNNQVVLFNGTSGGVSGLWRTDGTATGTTQINGIGGVAPTGLNPSDLTVFNGQVLFNGASAANISGPAGHLGLWTTNGTAAGTQELTSISGAATTGLGLNPSDLTVFGNEVLFAGKDKDGLHGLWETNGTPGGTSELFAGAAPTGLLPSGLTVLGDKVLFNGLGASGNGLWVTDGTPGGTSELVSHLNPHFLTAFDGEALFNGIDSNGLRGLWETDGTALGTHELLAAAAGATLTSDPAGLDPSNFEIFNGEVLFSGKDASGKSQLWETNGKAGGTSELVAGASGTALAPFDLTAVSIATLPPPSATNFSVLDTTTNTSLQTNGVPYSGPVAGLQWEYIYAGSDNMNVTANVPNVFIHTGSGEDALDVSHANGNNVLDGSTGSNFLVGGTGNDTFFVDDRGPSSDIWSTVSHFHAGDAATIFGITQQGFDTSWVNGQGAAGYTGLTLHVTGGGHPTASLTLAGFTMADLKDGRISTSWGTEADGTPYLYVHANS